MKLLHRIKSRRRRRSTRRVLFGILIEFQRVSFLIMTTVASWRRRSFCFCTPPHIRQIWDPPDPPRTMHFQLVSVLWATYTQFDQYWSFHYFNIKFILPKSYHIRHVLFNFCYIFCGKVQVCPLMGGKWRGGNMNRRAVWVQN